MEDMIPATCRHCGRGLLLDTDEIIYKYAKDGRHFSCGCFEMELPVSSLSEKCEQMTDIVEAAKDFVDSCDLLGMWPVEVDSLARAIEIHREKFGD